MVKFLHPLVKMSPTEAAWVAGLLEGEGCFRCAMSKGHGYLSIVCKMTDEDVIRKLANTVKVGSVYGPYKPTGLGKKLQWVWQVQGNITCQFVIEQILPWLCSRRTARIAEAVAIATGRPRRRDAEHGSATMYRYHRCRCDECRAGNRARKYAADARRADGTAMPAGKQRLFDT